MLTLAAAVVMAAAVLERPTAAQETGGNGVYTTQFENDWLRVQRVRYPANSKVPVHGHPSTVTAYVYLSESSPVRFTHHGGRTHVVTRQPTTPGGFRVSRGGDESHAAENLGPIASDYLRIEFKTEPAGNTSPFFRDSRPLTGATKATSEERFANGMMRISRVAIPAGQQVEVATAASEPALLLTLADASLTADGAALPLKIGQERWLAANARQRLANTGTTAVELIRIDVLTAPARPRK